MAAGYCEVVLGFMMYVLYNSTRTYSITKLSSSWGVAVLALLKPADIIGQWELFLVNPLHNPYPTYN